MVALWKTEDGTLNVKTMVYLLGNVKQVLDFQNTSIKMIAFLKDWFAGLSTLESFVKYLKTTELPDLKVLQLILHRFSIMNYRKCTQGVIMQGTITMVHLYLVYRHCIDRLEF